MAMRRPLFGGADSSAEFVTPGHPDKVCDQIAGRIVDQALAIDPNARVAIEMVACNGKVRVGGELKECLIGKIDIESAVRDVFGALGYHDPIDVDHFINAQSSDIKTHVDAQGAEDAQGAGDQGIMCGYAMYAPDREHLPAAYWYAQRLAMRLFEVAQGQMIEGLFTDGKTQVVITAGRISHITLAVHHSDRWSVGPNRKPELTEPLYEKVVLPIAGQVPSFIVNGGSLFTAGSIWADAAEVGRKIVIDQLGPDVPVGGGTLNGKDPSKVDLSGAVMARHIAKTIVANKLADEALVQFTFTIGQPEPDKLLVFAPGWNRAESPEDWCRSNFPMTVAGIIEHLGLNQPQGWSFEDAAQFGFYGHPHFPWEQPISV
jgi:S-adenosylmethionine synthetase